MRGSPAQSVGCMRYTECVKNAAEAVLFGQKGWHQVLGHQFSSHPVLNSGVESLILETGICNFDG